MINWNTQIEQLEKVRPTSSSCRPTLLSLFRKGRRGKRAYLSLRKKVCEVPSKKISLVCGVSSPLFSEHGVKRTPQRRCCRHVDAPHNGIHGTTNGVTLSIPGHESNNRLTGNAAADK